MQLDFTVPSHVLAPTIIALLTAAAVAILLRRSTIEGVYEPTKKHVIKVEELWHYPVKGLGGIKLDTATIGRQGFEDDRTFCLEKIHRDPETGEIKVWETMYSGFHLRMVLFQYIVEDRHLRSQGAKITITHLGSENPDPKKLQFDGKSEHQTQFPLRPQIHKLDKVHLDLHGSATDAYDMGSDVSAWLSKYLGFETKLVYIGNGSRVVLGSGAPNGDMAIAKRAPITAQHR